MKYKEVYQFRWVIVLVLLFLIFLSNFILLKLYFIGTSFPERDAEHGLFSFLLSFLPRFHIEVQIYNLQTIFVWAAGFILGSRLGFLTLAIYIALGLLGLPLFASGGGFDYYKEPTFGYLISLPFNAYLAGFLRENNKKALGVFVPIIVTHLFGVTYLLLFKQSWLEVSWYLSFSMIGYDFLFAALLTFVLPPIAFLLKEIAIQEIPQYHNPHAERKFIPYKT